MPFQNSDGLEYYYFDIFPKHLMHGIYTRKGGVSPKPWDTLNLGGTVGDVRENVIENRWRLFCAIDQPVESIFDVWQVHGSDVVCSESPRALEAPHKNADAILSNSPEITLLMRFADCVPILLYDPVKRVMGMVHAGWLGTVKRITSLAVQKMHNHYGCRPEDILAGIGPSICVDHYEIGEDVASKVQETYGRSSNEIILKINGLSHLDLWKANKITLEEAGVGVVQVSGECTACNLDKWYSHRGENGATGRFAAIMALREK